MCFSNFLGLIFIVFFIVGFIYLVAYIHVSIWYNNKTIKKLENDIYLLKEEYGNKKSSDK